MSFTFASARFGQIPGEDGGAFDPFSSTSSGSATTPGGGASSGGGGTRSYGDSSPVMTQYGEASTPGTSTRSSSASTQYVEGKKSSKSAIEAKKKELAKAADKRAKAGTDTLVKILINDVYKDSAAIAAKKAVDAADAQYTAEIKTIGRYNAAALEAARQKYQQAKEPLLATWRSALVESAKGLVSSCFYYEIPRVISATGRVAPFALLHSLRDTIVKALISARPPVVNQSAWTAAIRGFQNSASMATSRRSLPYGSEGSLITDNGDINLQKLPYGPFEALIAASVSGIDFPELGWTADQVQKYFYRTFVVFYARTDFPVSQKDRSVVIQRIAGNAAAGLIGVPDTEVRRLRKELQILESGVGASGDMSLYEGGKSTAATYTGAKSAYVKQKQNEAKEKALALENARRDRAAKTEQYRKANEAKRKAEAENNTAEAARQQKILDDAASAAAAAEARAAAAEKALQEAQAAVNAATQTAQPIPGVVQAGGGGEISPPTLAPAVVTPTEAPSPTGETAIVTTDSTGTPAVVVPDAAVGPVVTPVPAKAGPNVGLLVVAALAVGGGIWWFKNRRA